ncbi:MAG: pyrroline-5-carboxylate reductase family protein, partial [Nitrososphaerales archaeon]
RRLAVPATGACWLGRRHMTDKHLPDEQTLAFIGGGHITEILLHNLVRARGPAGVIVSDPLEERRQHLHEEFRVETAADNTAAARRGDLILINLRPEVVASVIPELVRAGLSRDQVVISLAAGIPLSRYAVLGPEQPLVRGLPNPPSRIGQGVAALAFTPQVTDEQRAVVRALFASLGQVVEVDEASLNLITALSSPAATLLFFEALVDAGVRGGLPRKVATEVASQTISGSLAMWRERSISPADLIAEAATPGGISVETLFVLEQRAFKGAIMEAIERGAERAAVLAQV